jgi:outer membrane lipoprotein-sorting protein
VKFLRTASTGRLLATIVAALTAGATGAAIAVAATGSGPVPPATTLGKAVHTALGASASHPVTGVSADITFTDNLIDSSDFTGQANDPLLQGASGRVWWSADGQLRIELQSDNGDAQIVIDHRSWWISDPAENVVYQGTLPAASGSSDTGSAGSGSSAAGHSVPTLAAIDSELTRLMGSLDIAGPQATDVAGRPAYRVTVSPKTSAGLLGSVQLAWDAARGVPLQFDLYARGDTTPVLGLQATSISYGAVAASVFAISPPAGARLVHVGGSDNGGAKHPRRPVTGVTRVGSHLDFALDPPTTVDGLALGRTRLVDLGGPGALMVYGHGLGTIVAIESEAPHGASTAAPAVGGLSLPTRTVDGASATVLATPLGTVLEFTRGGITYTVIGSITASSAQSAAEALAAGG